METIEIIKTEIIKTEIVKIDRVRLDDRTFSVSFGGDGLETSGQGADFSLDALADSIKRIGLINVPSLIRLGDGTHVIVCGFRRVAACARLGMDEIKAHILEAEVTPLDCAKRAIADNSFSRPLNLMEQANAAALLSRFMTASGSPSGAGAKGDETKETQAKETKAKEKSGRPKRSNPKRNNPPKNRQTSQYAQTAAALGLPGNPVMLGHLKKIYLLPRQVKQGIASGRVSLAMALSLAGLKKEEAIRFAEIFDMLKLGFSKQKECVALVSEIAMREDISIMDVFSDAHFLETVNPKDDRDVPLKTKRVRRYLKKRRFPALSKAEEDFEATLKTLHLSGGAAITPPQFFEGNSYMLRFPFSSPQDIKAHKKTMDALVGHGALEKFPGFKS